MSNYPFQEELRVSRLLMIVAICLVALTVAGHFRITRDHIGEEIPQMPGRSLSTLSTPVQSQEGGIRTSSQRWMI